MSLYTDRGGHYFHTPKAAARSTAAHPTQVGRALAQLGRRAYRGLLAAGAGAFGAGLPNACRTDCRRSSGSPGSRRSRRPTPSSARSICPDHNARFAVIRPARARPSRPFRASISTRSCACRRSGRSANDNCVSYRTLKLQIPESPMRPHFVKAKVKVHVYPDGSHALFHGPTLHRPLRRRTERSRDSHEKRAA